jgi:hypothetical protein
MAESSMLPGNAEFTHEFFEDASREWKKNKIRRGMMYSYKCSFHGPRSGHCVRPCHKESSYCSIHKYSLQARENPFALPPKCST